MAQLEGSVMTFSLPSFSAAATSALVPPHEAAEVHVAQFVVEAALELPPPAAALLDELAELVELELLLHPAASRTDPTAAAAATIALDARK